MAVGDTINLGVAVQALNVLVFTKSKIVVFDGGLRPLLGRERDRFANKMASIPLDVARKLLAAAYGQVALSEHPYVEGRHVLLLDVAVDLRFHTPYCWPREFFPTLESAILRQNQQGFGPLKTRTIARTEGKSATASQNQIENS